MEKVKKIIDKLLGREDWRDIDENSYFGKEIIYVKKNSPEEVFFSRSKFNNEESLRELFNEIVELEEKDYTDKYIHPSTSFELRKPSKKSNRVEVYIIYYIGGKKEENDWNICKLNASVEFKEKENLTKVNFYRNNEEKVYESLEVGEKEDIIGEEKFEEILFGALEDHYLRRLWNSKEYEDKMRDKKEDSSQ